MFSKVHSLIRGNTNKYNEKDLKQQLVPHVDQNPVKLVRPVDIARRRNNILKERYETYLKEQYVIVRDKSIKEGRLYFALKIDNAYWNKQVNVTLTKMGHEDGYKTELDTFGSGEFIVFRDPDPNSGYNRDHLCGLNNPEGFAIRDIDDA